VVVGLFVTIVLWRNGALGFLELLYTPTAMILAQLVIAAPIVIGLTLAAIQQIPEKFRLQLLGLGASHAQMVWTLLKEARLPMLAAVMAGFGAVISEVGASLMVGGNIKNSTRCSPPPPCSRRAKATSTWPSRSPSFCSPSCSS
jgi:tungstate transport system permease protein